MSDRDPLEPLGRFASTRTARVLGWSAVAGWCVLVAVTLSRHL